jgi:hypothetical protein
MVNRRTKPLTRPQVDDPAPGRDDTIGDFIVEQIRAGVDPNYAAGVAGVTTAELQAWMREGTVCFARLNAGAHWVKDFNAEQRKLAWFTDKAVRAISAHISRLAIIAEQVARGTLPPKVEIRTKTDARGRVVETTRVETSHLPDANMLQWKLEKLAPTVYGSRATLNLTVTDLTDSEDEADVLARKMRDVAASLAIEASSSD